METKKDPIKRAVAPILESLEEILLEEYEIASKGDDPNSPEYLVLKVSDINALNNEMIKYPIYKVISLQHNIESHTYEVFICKDRSTWPIPCAG